MTAAVVPAVLTTTELQALDAAERWALEDSLDQAQDILREFNDEELRRWVEIEGKTQRQIAEMVGRSKRAIAKRAERLGLVARDNRGGSRLGTGTQAGADDAEIVEGEVVEPTRRRRQPANGPAHHLPDVVALDAEENLRTQALHWFEQGVHIKELLDRRRPLEPRSPEDRKAIARQAGVMERVARRIKEAANV